MASVRIALVKAINFYTKLRLLAECRLFNAVARLKATVHFKAIEYLKAIAHSFLAKRQSPPG